MFETAGPATFDPVRLLLLAFCSAMTVNHLKLFTCLAGLSPFWITAGWICTVGSKTCMMC